MRGYLDLIQRILDEGRVREDRTGVGTRGIFCHQLRIDLTHGFPLLTTKKLHLRSILHELLWFLSGDTHVRALQENRVRIWDAWATEEQCARFGRQPGDLGPIYGHQWRNFGATRRAAGHGAAGGRVHPHLRRRPPLPEPRGPGAGAGPSGAAAPADDDAESGGHGPVRLPALRLHAVGLRPPPAHQGGGGGVRELFVVAAVARNGVIGRDGGLPWRIPEDLRRFRRDTLGHAVIMGRSTWRSIGRPLPGRRNIVLSGRPGLSLPGAEVASSLAEALSLAYRGDEAPRVIGGAAVYPEALPLATTLLLTEVDQEPEGDVHFPTVDRAEWQEVTREPRDGFAFVRWTRRA